MRRCGAARSTSSPPNMRRRSGAEGRDRHRRRRRGGAPADCRGGARPGDRRGAGESVGQGRRGGGRRQARPAAPAGLCARARARGRRAVSGSGPDERTRAPARRAICSASRPNRSPRCLLRLKGYTILARRFVVSGGEIDLIARRGGSIAFVEVKARADLEIAAICDQRDQAAANRARRPGLAGAQPLGGGPDAAGRRRLRRARTPSPSRAVRV